MHKLMRREKYVSIQVKKSILYDPSIKSYYKYTLVKFFLLCLYTYKKKVMD